MGFFGSILKAAVKTVIIPAAVAVDVLDVVTGDEPKQTSNLIDSIEDDIDEALND